MMAGGQLPLRTDNIQGNILAPFNKPHQRFVFINFQNDTDVARRWLRHLSDGKLIATTDAVVENAADRDRTWVGVSLTSSGLMTVNTAYAEDLVKFPAFWAGALADRVTDEWGRTYSAALVSDVKAGDPTGWRVGGPVGAVVDVPVDAVVTVAADVAADIGAVKTRLGLDGDDAILDPDCVIFEQDCAKLPDGKEHFGFKDGISQPAIRGFTDEAALPAGWPIIAAGEFVLGYESEERTPPRDPAPGWMEDGSFQAIALLDQDVWAWRQQMLELAASSIGNVDMGARAIGRYPDGRPLDRPGGGAINDFNYDDDPLGLVTPRFAHIRKMYPRHNDETQDRTHRLIRRGISYGTVLPGDAPDNGQEVRGLAFNAYMASIEDQFEYLLRNWASNPDTATQPITPDGPDPVVGASDAPCLLRRAGRMPVPIDYGNYVSTKGAAYAFAPSLSTLSDLGNLEG